MIHLLRLTQTPVGQLTDDDLTAVVQKIAGGDAPVLLELFKTLRDAEPGLPPLELLGSPVAQRIMQGGIESLRAAEAQEQGILCRCPHCNFAFVTD